MKKLSNGEDSTLGNYRKLAAMFFGVASKPVDYLNKRIAESPKGEMEEVMADERQMVQLLISMNGVIEE